MTEREAALTSMNEYRLRIQGFEKKEQRRYELARWLAWRLMAPHFKAGRAPSTAQKYIRFAWEEPDGPTTEQQARQMLERSKVTEREAAALDRLFARLHGQDS